MRDEIGKREGLAGACRLRGIGDDLAIKADQHHGVGIDTGAMIGQRRHHRGPVAGGERFAKGEIGRKNARALCQLQRVLFKQTAENALAGLQLVTDGLAGVRCADLVQQQAVANLQ